ncbi:hypothetical protein J4732_17470 [Serratia marcescens]|uniref:Uncharacterized protein n=1 Tax=Serratia marcescens TaxID=615 RepID=A0A939NLG9_SERMA|nr:hypothetical protein [Serratia marcescens]
MWLWRLGERRDHRKYRAINAIAQAAAGSQRHEGQTGGRLLNRHAAVQCRGMA